ncbi:transposase [Parendozoicomonas callyspongiae]
MYQKRWHVELDLRSIKTLMKMDILRCKSPDMVRKEISVHLLAYNLLRALMARTAQMTGQSPREISFRAAQQTVRDFRILLLSTDDLAGVVDVMLGIMAEHQAGDRSGRSEPRAVKRRPKAFPKLQHSHAKARRLKTYQGKAA